MKKIAISADARQKLVEGSELLYNCVTPTLGPKCRNVAVAREWQPPYVMHDGVTVAQQVECEDEFKQMGVELVRQAAIATVASVGDSTTTTILFAHKLIEGGKKLIDNGLNPMVLRKQLFSALNNLSPEIKKLAKEIKSKEDIARIATVAANNEEIGKLVAEALDKVGSDGQITVEEVKTANTRLEMITGMTFDKGYTSQYFVTNPQQMEAVVENPLVCIFGRKVTLPNEIIPFLDVLTQLSENKHIVFFGDIGGDALKIILQLKIDNNISALVADVPGVGARRQNYLDDIALITGGRVLDTEIGYDTAHLQKDLSIDFFGHAKAVVADKKTTTIIPAEPEDYEGGDRKRIEAIKKAVVTKIDSLRAQIKNEEMDYDRELLQERLAKLTTGVAVIKVGTTTEVELREKVEVVKDAIGAAKAAMVEGVVAGGGTTFLKIRKTIDTSTDGGKLLYEALSGVTEKLMLNAGETLEEAKDNIAKIEAALDNLGYEANEGKLTDLMEAGVIDPAMAIRMSLENAVSVATTVLTTDVLIAKEYIKPVAFKQ